MTKHELRQEMKRIFATTTEAQRQEWSEQICAHLMEEPHIKNATHIMAFHPLNDEVDIKPLLHALIQHGKTVLLPEVVSTHDMVLHVYNKETTLCKGALGTQHPMSDVFEDYESIGATLVPGLAFTTEGHRLGRGKAYYDTFLPKLTNAHTIGVCFPFQVVEHIPCEPHDIILDSVTTLNNP